MNQAALSLASGPADKVVEVSMAAVRVSVRVVSDGGRITGISASGADEMRMRFISATDAALRSGKTVADLAVQVTAWRDLLLALRRVEVER